MISQVQSYRPHPLPLHQKAPSSTGVNPFTAIHQVPSMRATTVQPRFSSDGDHLEINSRPKSHTEAVNELLAQKQAVYDEIVSAQGSLLARQAESLGTSRGLYPQENLLSKDLIAEVDPRLNEIQVQLEERRNYSDNLLSSRSAGLGAATGLAGGLILNFLDVMGVDKMNVVGPMGDFFYYFMKAMLPLMGMATGLSGGLVTGLFGPDAIPRFKAWSTFFLRGEHAQMQRTRNEMAEELQLNSQLEELLQRSEQARAEGGIPSFTAEERQLLISAQTSRLVENQELHHRLFSGG